MPPPPTRPYSPQMGLGLVHHEISSCCPANRVLAAAFSPTVRTKTHAAGVTRAAAGHARTWRPDKPLLVPDDITSPSAADPRGVRFDKNLRRVKTLHVYAGCPVTTGPTANDMSSESFILLLYITLHSKITAEHTDVCGIQRWHRLMSYTCVGNADERASPPPPCWRCRSPSLEARVYVSLRVFPPTALHPILLNKGAWGSGVKWEWAHEWKGTNWHVAFCEVSAQPLDRWLPFANEHPGLCVPAFPSASLQNVLSPLQLCAGLEWPVDHRYTVNWETHTSVIKAVGGLVLYQLPPMPRL